MINRAVLAGLVALAVAGLLGGCGDDAQQRSDTAPAALTGDAIGYYCNMVVEAHLGPKGQVHLPGRSEPLWFTSVRDTLAFTMLPEEPKNALAIYVNDMGRASWDHPEPDTWIEAQHAWYVVGSDRTGGMGAPETVPFAEREAADAFAARHGGEVMGFDDIPQSAVLGHAASHSGTATMHEPSSATQHGHGHKTHE